MFCNEKYGIIQSVEKPEGTDCMDKMDHNAHSVYLMYYHLIMVVRYRRKVIDDPISERAKEIWEHIAKLMEKRRELYVNACDIKVATDRKTPQEIAEEILKISQS